MIGRIVSTLIYVNFKLTKRDLWSRGLTEVQFIINYGVIINTSSVYFFRIKKKVYIILPTLERARLAGWSSAICNELFDDMFVDILCS